MKNLGAIYILFSKSSGLFYIGKSKRFTSRKGEHLRNIRTISHSNWSVQYLLGDKPEDDLQFEILEICNERDLTDRENDWINRYSKCQNCLNLMSRRQPTDSVRKTLQKRHLDFKAQKSPAQIIEDYLLFVKETSLYNRSYKEVGEGG